MFHNWRTIVEQRLPYFLSDSIDWAEWRLVYEGGKRFRDRYLESYGERETPEEFARRKRSTPIAAHAKAAINRIKNSVFQRFPDILRRGGSKEYQAALTGDGRGVDGRGSSMNSFIGARVLPDLLVMGKVGIYVDAPAAKGDTAADRQGKTPYIYTYAVEQICDICLAPPDSESDFAFVLLSDVATTGNPVTGKINSVTRYRYLWIDEDGAVKLQFITGKGEPEGATITLDLKAIPFVLADIGDSLIKDVCSHQIALLNMSSNDTTYLLDSNFPFLTRQKDTRDVGEHLKDEGDDIEVGAKKGLIYSPKMNAPAFISPPVDPITASMAARKMLRDEIFEFVNLAVENANTEDPGLDSGLAFIGQILEMVEQRIADHWSAYESIDAAKRQTAVVKYPGQWKLVPDSERIETAEALTALAFKIPGEKVKKALYQMAASKLFRGQVTAEELAEIAEDIKNVNYCTSDPEIILAAKEQGACSVETATRALGFDDQEAAKAQADHAKRLAEISMHESAAARGVDDRETKPGDPAAEEKELSRDNTQDPTTESKVRGKGKVAPNE